MAALPALRFSLEANTESVPSEGCYHLLKNGQVLLRSDDLTAASEALRDLCRELWNRHLGSADPASRRAGAMGLLGLNPADEAAAAVIREDGTAADRKWLDQAQNRARSLTARLARSSRGRRAA